MTLGRHTNTGCDAQSSTREQLRGTTIAAQSTRARLDNFAHAERSGPTANAHEATTIVPRSWHPQRLPQRHRFASQILRPQNKLTTSCTSAAAASTRCDVGFYVVHSNCSRWRCLQARWQPVLDVQFHAISVHRHRQRNAVASVASQLTAPLQDSQPYLNLRMNE